jgi:hypothetical protein
MGPVTDLSDVRVLIPRMRRALDGPEATGSAAVSAKLSDDQVTAVIADAIADVIFYSSGAFPHKLEVVERDTAYMAPSAWKTDTPMSEDEQSVIVAQAALNYFLNSLSNLKSSETLKEADREWTWAISASALAERVKELRAQRDKAVELLTAQNVIAEAWINTLEVRDRYTDMLIEPYLSNMGFSTGMGGNEFDPPLGGP